VEMNTRTEQQLDKRNSKEQHWTGENVKQQEDKAEDDVGVDLLCLHKQRGRSSKSDGTQSRHSFVNQVSSRRTTYTSHPLSNAKIQIGLPLIGLVYMKSDIWDCGNQSNRSFRKKGVKKGAGK